MNILLLTLLSVLVIAGLRFMNRRLPDNFDARAPLDEPEVSPAEDYLDDSEEDDTYRPLLGQWVSKPVRVLVYLAAFGASYVYSIPVLNGHNSFATYNSYGEPTGIFVVMPLVAFISLLALNSEILKWGKAVALTFLLVILLIPVTLFMGFILYFTF